MIFVTLFAWQVQGGVRQDIQVTERANIIQPAQIQIQDNDPEQEIQPAIGWRALDTGAPVAEIRK